MPASSASRGQPKGRDRRRIRSRSWSGRTGMTSRLSRSSRASAVTRQGAIMTRNQSRMALLCLGALLTSAAASAQTNNQYNNKNAPPPPRPAPAPPRPAQVQMPQNFQMQVNHPPAINQPIGGMAGTTPQMATPPAQ